MYNFLKSIITPYHQVVTLVVEIVLPEKKICQKRKIEVRTICNTMVELDEKEETPTPAYEKAKWFCPQTKKGHCVKVQKKKRRIPWAFSQRFTLLHKYISKMKKSFDLGKGTYLILHSKPLVWFKQLRGTYCLSSFFIALDSPAFKERWCCLHEGSEVIRYCTVDNWYVRYSGLNKIGFRHLGAIVEASFINSLLELYPTGTYTQLHYQG